jgi:hypothetical protein
VPLRQPTTRRGLASPSALEANARTSGVCERSSATVRIGSGFPRRFDPIRSLATPRSISRLIGPDPRIIADDVWAKLLHAGCNLQQQDLPPGGQRNGTPGPPRYPLELVQAVAWLWLFAGLRLNEITRLRRGCIRWQVDLGGDVLDSPPRNTICLLDVPTNKTDTAYTKPVDGHVGEAVERWEAIRGSQPPFLDAKTNQMVDVLFAYRGKRLGKGYINRRLIPMLCKKANVPASPSPPVPTGRSIRPWRGCPVFCVGGFWVQLGRRSPKWILNASSAVVQFRVLVHCGTALRMAR